MDDAEIWRMATQCAMKNGSGIPFEDMRQDCALAGWRALQRWDSSKGAKVYGFVWRAMEYACIEYYRHAYWRKRSQAAQPFERPPSVSLERMNAELYGWEPTYVEAGYGSVELSQTVRAVVAYLDETIGPEAVELLLRVHYLGELRKDIAAELGVTPGAITLRLRQAEVDARAALADWIMS